MTTPADDPYAPTTPGRKPAAGGTVPVRSMVGRRLGDYEILEPLGEGGMGVVYRAKDATLDREVALKVLQPWLAQDEEYERRFLREAKTAAKLDHPNIVGVFAAGRADTVLFMAMQLVRGETLHQLLRKRRRMPVAEALGVARQAAAGLEAAHREGLVHRDIKPNNIMVDADGRVKIMDFGLMRSKAGGEAITQRGDFFGTPEYASPEQCETAELDGRSDLYSLGVVLYEMIAGRMPYKADTPLALFKKILHEKPPALRKLNPQVPPAVEALVERLLAKNPANRFRTAGEAAVAIEEAMKAPPGPGARLRTVRLGAGAALLVLLGGLTAMGIGLLGRTRSEGPVGPTGDPGLRAVSTSERFGLAILDFKNGTPDLATNYYEIALSDLLIASLSQYPGLDVPSRETLMWAHGGTKETVDASDAERLARGKSAAGVVTGKYYVRGGKIRVTLSGYRLPGREPLFAARSFERSEEDVFVLVDEAARSIAKDLEGRLVPPPTASVEVRPCLEMARAWHSGSPAEEAAKQGRHEDRKLALAEKGGQLRSTAEAQAQPAAGASPSVDARERPLGGAPPASPKPGGAERRKSPPIPPLSEPELLKAWYQNRHALEECNFQREDFEALSRSLRAQFQAGAIDGAAFRKGVENFRTGIDRLREARGQRDKDAGGGGARPSIDFACPDCGKASSEFSRCETCDRSLVLRIALPGPAPEKKP